MMHPRTLLLLVTATILLRTSMSQSRRRKDPRPMGFWRGLVFQEHSKGTQRGPRNTNRKRDESSNLVLMTECPLNSQCVDRNFCDDEGFITNRKINNYSLKQDKRKFIACVDLVNMDLAVCCTHRPAGSSGSRDVRQDKPENARHKPMTVLDDAINMSESDFSDLEDILTKNFMNNDDQTDIGNENVAISVGEAKDGRPLIIINVNAGIFNRPRSKGFERPKSTEQRITSVENAQQIDTTIIDNFDQTDTTFVDDFPQIDTTFDVNFGQIDDTFDDNPGVENFDPVVETVNTVSFNNNNNNNNNDNTNVFVTCPAATVCVAKSRCDFSGVLTNRTVVLDPRVEALRAPLNVCISSSNIKRRRRGRAGQDMVCCRDPNYKDPWPDMKKKKKKKVHSGYDHTRNRSFDIDNEELETFMEDRRSRISRRRRPNGRRFFNRF